MRLVWIGWASVVIGMLIVLSVRYQHLTAYPHLTEMEALIFWAPWWVGSAILCVFGYAVLKLR